MRKPTIRRLFAYLIDVVIVALIASALASTKYLNPYIKEYTKADIKYQEFVNEAAKDTKKAQELLNGEELKDLTYDMSKSGVFVSIYTVVISLLYFVCFQYYTKGKTLGKLVTKIEVVSNNKGKLRFIQLLKRSMIINSLITSSILVILILVLSKNNYMNYSRYVQLLDYSLILLSIGFVLYREDGRGLHDLFGGTRVIMSEEKEYFLKHDNVKEALIVEDETIKEDSSEDNKQVKKTTKKNTNKKSVKKGK